MSIPSRSLRPLSALKSTLRQCRPQRQKQHFYSTDLQQTDPATSEPLLEDELPTGPKFPFPPKGFRPSQTTKQNRTPIQITSPTPIHLTSIPGFNHPTHPLPKIPVYPPPRTLTKTCSDPVAAINAAQIALLDPTGARTRLFARTNPDRVKQGDILHVRFKNENPVSGVCLSVRQRHQPVDTAVLLRNQLTRVGVEMWVKVYSPNVEGIEVVQRKEKQARRKRLYYMRLPKHDVGSVEGVVRGYLWQKAGPIASTNVKARDANAGKKKNNKRGRN